jgi:hypothetical protein
MRMTATQFTHPEEIARAVYNQTRVFAPIAALRREQGMGFEILLGPPYKNPPIAFIGYQPGEWSMTTAQARENGYEDGWVTDECQFASADWPLAKRLREIFPKSMLAGCVGLNAVFLRAKKLDEYRKKVCFRDRQRIEDFCREQVQTLLRAIEPRNLIVIGHETLNLFCDGTPVLRSAAGRTLVKSGELFGQQAHAILHLSGARISNPDRCDIGRYLRLHTSIPTPPEVNVTNQFV